MQTLIPLVYLWTPPYSLFCAKTRNCSKLDLSTEHSLLTHF